MLLSIYTRTLSKLDSFSLVGRKYEQSFYDPLPAGLWGISRILFQNPLLGE